MSDQPTDLPEGAVPTEVDSPEEPATEPHPEDTMIGDEERVTDSDSVIVDSDEVLGVVEEIESYGEGEPLPVGANDPEVVADQPTEPPGMPHEADDLDREMAALAQHLVDHDYHRQHVRPDSANVQQARRGEIITDTIKPRNVRQALLVHIQQMRDVEVREVKDYAAALRTVQEARDAYVIARDARGGAEEALFVMGLDIEDDHEPTVAESPEPAPIPDSAIR
jgi:hypothetical protein